MIENNQKKKNKTKLPVIGIVVFIILAVCIIGVIIYTVIGANLFKTNKQLFLENTAKITKDKNSFVTEELQNYMKLKSKTPYENKMNLEFDIDKKEVANINNFNIKSSGKIDRANKNLEQNIVIEYSENNNFPLTYKKYGDLVGIQTDNIGSKFVTSDINKLNEYTDNLGIISVLEYLELINYSINLEYLNIEEGKKQAIVNLVINYFPEENYHVIKEGSNEAYRLSTTYSEMQSLIDEIYNLVKDDIKNEPVQDILTNVKENIYKKIENNNSENETFDIVITTNNRKINKIEIYIGTSKIQIEKNVENENLEYLIRYEEYSTEKQQSEGNTDTLFKLDLRIAYEGLKNPGNIKEIYQLEINDKTEDTVYTYNIENENVFIQNLEISNFNNDDTMFLDNKTNSEVQEFLKKVENRLISVNNEQMEKLNLKGEDNTLKYIIPTKILDFLSGKEININENNISRDK